MTDYTITSVVNTPSDQIATKSFIGSNYAPLSGASFIGSISTPNLTSTTSIFGSGTSYTQIGSDGTLRMLGSATQWNDLRIEPIARNTGANAPAYEKWFSSGASRGVYLYSFDDSVTEKELFFTMQMDHSWAGTPIHMHVHYVPEITQAGSQITWALEYNWTSIGSLYGTTNTVYSYNAEPIDGVGSTLTANAHMLNEFSSIDPTTTGASGLSSILIGRLFRNSTNGSDTYTGKVGLLYIDAHYEQNSFGSNDELSK